MPSRFYVDADLLGLAKILVLVRADVTYPGDPGGLGPAGLPRLPCPIKPGEKDHVWIPLAASEGWIVITRDRRLLNRPAERRAIIASAARVIQLDARHELNKWLQLEIVVSQWRRFEELAEMAGPWVHVASRSSLRKVPM